ncbi:hypothetical protein RSOLAG22IIIB_06047 [Rhizoctonia solani]|uniref:ATPase inhibitor, mitochondrial n=1 Tax=Rhizoctonia solani TaxID=456999 RepID=A0A0K6GB98_9AGAM|nr:hypothetical protein RSOLAG22IIIB_06047 [Rhizoctonia solani]
MIARIALRTATHQARIAASRATAVRFYSEDQFGRKEKAHEDQYIRKHQEEQLKKLKEQLAKNKAEGAQLEQEINKHEAKAERK